MEIKHSKHRPVSDLVLVGLGVSNATSLKELLEQVIRQPPADALRITLVEKHEVHYTGVAYGPRSGPNSLIISTLEDFIDSEDRADFIAWIKANQTWLLNTFRERGGELSAQWFERFQQADDESLESRICIPRAFFGYFLREKINRLIDTASALGHVRITSITAEVTDMQRKNFGFSLSLSDGSQPVRARKVMLGIGPPSHQTLKRRTSRFDDSLIIDNPYAGNIGTLCRSLSRHWVRPGKDAVKRASLNILLVGANASAIEAAYLLFDQKELRRLIRRITVLSPSGRFPDRRPSPQTSRFVDYRAVHLEELAGSESVTAREVYLAFMADLNLWRALDPDASEPVVSLGREVVACVQRLSTTQKQLFTDRYGVLIGKHQRRSGDEYLDFAGQLGNASRLMHVRGRFKEVTGHGKSGYRVSYVPSGADKVAPMDDNFHMVVNCMGPTSLHEPQGPLISQLIKRGICKVNESGRGFTLRDDYSAVENLIVTGPLISGNVIADQAVWHVEHCGRLTAIGKVLGQRLHQSVAQQEQAAA